MNLHHGILLNLFVPRISRDNFNWNQLIYIEYSFHIIFIIRHVFDVIHFSLKLLNNIWCISFFYFLQIRFNFFLKSNINIFFSTCDVFVQLFYIFFLRSRNKLFFFFIKSVIYAWTYFLVCIIWSKVFFSCLFV